MYSVVPVAKRVTLASSLVKYYSRYMIQEIFIYIFTCDLLLDLLASAYFIYCLHTASAKPGLKQFPPAILLLLSLILN